jgi:2-polyprenyl-3-methyl-5-hydroxy-6-metoxy-1,4-benzoquinol methylase
MNCPACKSKEIESFYGIVDLPLLIFPVDERVKMEIKRGDINAFICNKCNHVFTSPISQEYTDLIYGDYYSYYPYDNLESMNTYYRMPFESFFKETWEANSGRGKTLLEIGCSSGAQLHFFDELGFTSKGIDPSPLNTADKDKIISGFYSDYELGDKYDVIVVRFVLEHINDVSEFLGKITRDLTIGGKVYFQVPNVMAFIKNFIPNFLAHEHSHYFNELSISKMAEMHGFEVDEIQFEDSQSICIALTVGGSKGKESLELISEAQVFSDFLDKRKMLGQQVLELIESKQRNICYYGSGLMLTWILYDLRLLKIQDTGHVIDDNEKLVGRFMPNSNYRIEACTDSIKHFESVLLTLNPVYHSDVIAKLNSMNYKGEIHSLSSDGLKQIS